MTKKIGIIGGGISGLVAAFLLKNRGLEVVLFEKSAAVGGNIQTKSEDGFLYELGPNSLLKSPRLVDLIGLLGLDGEVLAANATAKKRYVLRGGRLKALPMSVLKMAAGDFLSFGAKMRLLKEPFIRSKAADDESVAEFFTRRLGGEIVTRAADPFIAGIYAGKPENLSIKSAFPSLYELEKNYGSLFFGALRSKSEKTPKDFPRTFSFLNGIQTLTDALAAKLGESIKTNTEVLKIEKLSDGKFSVWERKHPACNERESAKNNDAKNHTAEEFSPPADSGDAGRMPALRFDAVIIATPAEAAANLTENLDADLSRLLREIYYPPVAMVFLGVKKDDLEKTLDGFGFLIPGSEKRKILGTVWNSAVFTGRAPDGFHLLTTFVGGTRDAEIFEKSDEDLFQIVESELGEILGLRADAPVFRRITRWRKAIPQYNVGYDKIEDAIENFEREMRGIFFCSNFYKGISVGDCVKNAFALAKRISHEQTQKGTK